jgi:cobalt-zinc-cadmium efflux system membrane fusion protein
MLRQGAVAASAATSEHHMTKEKNLGAAQKAPRTKPRIAAWTARICLAVAIVVGGLWALSRSQQSGHSDETRSGKTEQENHAGRFQPTEAQWASLSIEPVAERPFRSEVATDGKITIDENRSTPVFSPYSGRVTKIAAEPGDVIERGRLLFAIEATDMVQAQNDFIAALAGLETARSQLHLAEINEKRQHDLYDAKAVPLKDWQQAQADLIAAKDNLRTAQIALEAVENRLRILRKTDAEIGLL